MKFMVPMVLAFAGVGAGVGAGVLLRPEADVAAAPAEEAGGHATGSRASAKHGEEATKTTTDAHGTAGEAEAEYVSLNNQFIVPILEESAVRSIVVLSLDLEVAPGATETIYRVEPKLRDVFLTVLFDHANAGGFDGRFTSSGSMEILRRALREAGRKVAGDELSSVLITNIVRQDV